MAGVQVNKQDKAAIRDLTEEAIASGGGAKRLAELRKDLAATTGASIGSVRAVSAYVEYSATEAVHDAGLAGRLSNRDLVLSARLTRGTSTKEGDLALLAVQFGLETDDLSRAISLYEAYYQGRPGGRTQGPDGSGEKCRLPAPPPDSSAPVETEPPSVAVSELPFETADKAREGAVPEEESDDVDVETGVRGDTTNYDFPEKLEWRSAWANFIRDRFAGSKLREARVICLPGRAVEPEVAKYLAMGIRPENIHCVEGSRRVRDEFLGNALRLGVRPYPMSLRKALKQLGAEGLRFDVVNYDFHGQFCRGHLEALQETPLAADAIVVYNSLGKRENNPTQDTLKRRAAEHTSAMTQLGHQLTGSGTYEAARRLFGAISRGSTADAADGLRALRCKTIPNAVVAHAGQMYDRLDRALLLSAARALYTDESLEADDGGNQSASDIRSAMGDGFYKYQQIAPLGIHGLVETLGHRFPSRVFGGCDPLGLGLVLWHATFCVAYMVGDGCLYDYLSETKGRGPRAPFFTSMVQLRQPHTVLHEHRAALDFCSAWTREHRRCLAHPGREAEYAAGILGVVERDGYVRRVHTPLAWDDTISVYRNSERQASIAVGDLRHAMLAASALRRKDRLVL